MIDSSSSAFPERSEPTRARVLLLLAAILAGGAWLRLPGTLYPVPLHFDEGIYVQNVLCNVPPTGTFYHPFLGRYLLTIPETIPCVRALLRGSQHPARETQAEFLIEPAPFLALGRSLSMLVGLATVALLYWLGSALAGRAVGLTAALFVAVSPADVIVSNNLGHWCLATLSALTVFVMLRLAGQADATRRQLLALGLTTGLAVAVVYTLALVAIPILVMLAIRWRAQQQLGQAMTWVSDLATTAVGAIAGHVVGNFTGLTNLDIVIRELTVPEASLLSQQSTYIGYLTNAGWYVGTLFDRFGLGWAVATLGCTGLLLAAYCRRGLWLAILAFVLAVLFIQPAAVVLFAIRYTAPVTPLLALAAAWLLVATGRRLATNAGFARWQPTAVLTLLATVPGVLTDLAYHRALALTPTRLQARDWVENHLPNGSVVVQTVEFMGPALPDCRALQRISPQRAGRVCYDVRLSPVDAEHFTDGFLSWLPQSGADYVIYTAATPPGTLRRMGRSLHVSASLKTRYELLARFEHPGLDAFHDDTATINPAIEIYRLTP
jgi:Dolichyl-phosphate-mannose-protein mannosyltransferase